MLSVFMEWGGVKLLTLQVSQYPQWENERVHENEQEQQSTLKKKNSKIKVNHTEANLILNIFFLYNLTISCDPLLAEVLDKNDSMIAVQLSKKQTDRITKNLTMHFWKKY